MSGLVLAAYNLKGGVGKTAAAVNVAYAAARAGRTVLLWDLDPQGAASFYFRVKAKVKGGAKRLVSGKHQVGDFIKATNYAGLDLMPADFSYRNLDLYLTRKKRSRDRLRRMLKPVRGDYDVIIFDCSPGMTLVSENIFCAADALLIPLVPTHLSVRAYRQIRNYCGKHEEFKLEFNPFFSMVDRRRKLHCDIVNAFYREHPEMLKTVVGYSSLVEQMGARRAPVQVYAPSSPAAVAFDSLWQEICKRMGKTGGFLQNSNWN